MQFRSGRNIVLAITLCAFLTPKVIAAANGVEAHPEPPLTDRLGMIWREQEPDWTGTWTRRPGTIQFDAEFTNPGQPKITTVVSISIKNNDVIVQRIEPHCLLFYRGTISGSKVTGIFFPCGGNARPWTATILGVNGETEVAAEAGQTFNSTSEQNVDLIGAAYYRFTPPAPNSTYCQTACAADTLCSAWTYVLPNTIQGPSPQCFLKTGPYAPKSVAYAVSGFVRSRDISSVSFADAREASHGCEVMVYWDRDFKGELWRTIDNQPFVGDHWNDQISSIKIVKGLWEFHDNKDYGPGVMRLGPGSYPFLGFDWNDRISSFRCIASNP